MDKVRETYDMELDAKYAAARGFVRRGVCSRKTTRDALELESVDQPELQRATRRAIRAASDARIAHEVSNPRGSG